MDLFGEAMAFITLGTGVFLTVRLKGFQFTHLFASLRSVFSHEKRSDGMTAFQAAATALGGSVGTANIAGVAGAIALGGPGTVFWMWISALVGMATKFCETFLAVKYGGGAMVCIDKGLGKRFKPLAAAFSVFGALASLIGTSLVQSNTIALSALGAARSFGAVADKTPVLLAVGALTAILTALVIFGGARRIGRFSEKAVPFMALVYAAACAAVIAVNVKRLIPALESIFSSAFGFRSAAGCAVGFGFKKTLSIGVARGVYSNEAGVGSSPMAHASSSGTDPVKHGMLGIFEVFADTIVICSLTALALLTSGVLIPFGQSGASGAALASDAFSGIMGNASSVFISLSILVFAFTSLVGWSLYGECCIKYLFGKRAVPVFRVIYVLLIPLGAVAPVDAVWRIGETFNYLMALPNLFLLVLLAREAEAGILAYKMFEKRP